MAKEDYYQLLGVARNASDDEIKKSFRRLAMKYHPDRNQDNPEAEEQFKKIKEANDILSDPKKRAAYDQFGHAGVDPSMGGGGHGGAQFSDIFGDVFGDIFGGGGSRGRAGPQRGSDLRYNLEITLEEAVAGTEVKIPIPTLVSCKPCDGSGATKGSKVTMRSGCSKVSLAFSKPVQPAAAQANRSRTPAEAAMDKGVSRKPKPSLSRFRRASIPAIGFVWRGKAKRAKRALWRVIFMSKST